jgi:single-stranded DNA-binding protein
MEESKFQIVGRLQSAKEEFTRNNSRLIKAVIASTRQVKGEQRVSQCEVTFFGDHAAQLLATSPGTPVFVSGVIEGRAWESKDGGTRYSAELIGFSYLIAGRQVAPPAHHMAHESDLPF